MKFTKHLKKFLPLLAGLAIGGLAIAQDDEKSGDKKIKALLVTGEGYHDYEAQKKIITEGVSERMDIEWTVQHDKNAGECKANLSKEGWADGYDIVVYNICHANEADSKFIDSVAAVHGEKGIPAVVMHCTLHSFHWDVKVPEGDHATWVKLLGVRSRNHGPKAAITVTKVPGVDHPVTKDLPDGWKTPEGELYNVLEVLPTATALAKGDNGNVKEPQVCIWVNQYKKAKVFGTSIGHHNSTMQTKEFLDLITNGIKWAVSK